ncbi:MAG: hypothetical protein LZF62_410072 [Nitrospira sp.]|nr:MAG: hypothetical protein LZF62_410072 [Nitrospira sp.]
MLAAVLLDDPFEPPATVLNLSLLFPEKHPFFRFDRRVTHEHLIGTFPRLLARGAGDHLRLLCDRCSSSGPFP